MSWAIEEKAIRSVAPAGLIGLEPKTYRYASTVVTTRPCGYASAA